MNTEFESLCCGLRFSEQRFQAQPFFLISNEFPTGHKIKSCNVMESRCEMTLGFFLSSNGSYPNGRLMCACVHNT